MNNYKIIIRKHQPDGDETINEFLCDNYLLIMTDAIVKEKEKQFHLNSSSQSAPRQLGWLLFAIEYVKHQAQKYSFNAK